MLKSEVLEAADLLVLALEDEAEVVSAVGVFKTAGNLLEAGGNGGAVYFATSQNRTKGTVLTDLDNAGLLVAV